MTANNGPVIVIGSILLQILLKVMIVNYPFYTLTLFSIFRPEEPISHLVVCNNFLVMAMTHGVIMRLDLEHADEQERTFTH